MYKRFLQELVDRVKKIDELQGAKHGTDSVVAHDELVSFIRDTAPGLLNPPGTFWLRQSPVTPEQADAVDLPADYIRLLAELGVRLYPGTNRGTVWLRMNTSPEKLSIPYFSGYFDTFSGWEETERGWETRCSLSPVDSPCRPGLEELKSTAA